MSIPSCVAAISPVTLCKNLGLEGGVTVFKPEGRTCYYVFFRHRGRQYNRSCGTSDYSAAVANAAEIIAEVVRPQPKASASPSGPLTEPNERGSEIGIEEVIGLYDRWIRTAKPGHKRPRPETAKNYRRRLRQLCDLLDAGTVRELSEKLAGFSPERAKTSESNFVPMMRNAAAVFAEEPLKFFASSHVKIENPFGGCTPSAPEPSLFEAPSEVRIAAVNAAARAELKGKCPREWVLFLLTFGAGLRVQEATHLRWEDIKANGIQARASQTHRKKSGHGRFIPTGPALIGELMPFQSLPFDFVIPDAPGNAKKGQVAVIRCSRTARRLAGWLKKQGIGARCPNHFNRKVFGSIVAAEHGILAASRYLGHSSVRVTEEIYVGLLGGGPAANVI
jgi:integrase